MHPDRLPMDSQQLCSGPPHQSMFDWLLCNKERTRDNAKLLGDGIVGVGGHGSRGSSDDEIGQDHCSDGT